MDSFDALTANPLPDSWKDPYLALQLVLSGGKVTRFHCHSMIKPENVAEHSFLVAWLCILIAKYPSSALLMAALQHDLAEHVTGDMPAPVKRNPVLKKELGALEEKVLNAHAMEGYAAALTPSELRLLKIADNMAGWLRCLYEQSLGNRTIERMANRYADYVKTCIADAADMEPEWGREAIHIFNVINTKGIPV